MLGMVVNSSNHTMREMEALGLEVQGQPQLYRELEASIGYIRPCLKQINNKTRVMDFGEMALLLNILRTSVTTPTSAFLFCH